MINKSVFFLFLLLFSSVFNMATGAAEPIRIAYIMPLSGPFASVGVAALDHLQFTVDKINKEGGILGRKIEIIPMDNKHNPSESTILVQKAINDGVEFVTHGSGSNVGRAILKAVDRNNERNPNQRILYLNFGAIDPNLTNEDCSFWHFSFDANTGVKVNTNADYIANQEETKKVFLINQDYSHGHITSNLLQNGLKERRPDIEIVGDVFHPIGQVKDFSPYVSRIRQSGADSIFTSAYGNDLSLLIRATRSAGLNVRIYADYAGLIGAPSAIGESGNGRVFQVTEWHPDVNIEEEIEGYEDWFLAYQDRHPQGSWYFHRIYNQMFMLKKAIEESRSTDVYEVAKALEGMEFNSPTGKVLMRSDDHQLFQPLYVSVMDSDAKYDSENSGIGFRTVAKFSMEETIIPTTCEMQRPQD